MSDTNRRSFIKAILAAGGAAALGYEGWVHLAKLTKTDSIQITGVAMVEVSEHGELWEVHDENHNVLYDALDSLGKPIRVADNASKGKMTLEPGYYNVEYKLNDIKNPSDWNVLKFTTISKDEYDAAKTNASKAAAPGKITLDR